MKEEVNVCGVFETIKRAKIKNKYSDEKIEDGKMKTEENFSPARRYVGLNKCNQRERTSKVLFF